MGNAILEGEADDPQVIYPPNPTQTTNDFFVELPCGHRGWVDRAQWAGEVSIVCGKDGCTYHEMVDLSDQTPGAKQPEQE